LVESGPHAISDTVLGSSASGSASGYFDQVARLVAEVADALNHAHDQGVIHRDIKPSNLLLSPDGRLSVNDFGLARLLEQPGMTMTGEFVGTPMYMSPEQITAGRAPLDRRTDIYSLGATLYELLTLEPPFAAERRDQVIAQIMHKEPRSPRNANRRVPVDLETICQKAMEKDPDRRYQSGKEMADDLGRFVNRFAISARRVGLLVRAKKWVKRNPAMSVAGLVIVLALGSAGFFAWRAHQADQRRLAEGRRREAEALAEKRRAAVERAMTAALGADLAAAEKAVAEAELLQASTGETRMLRGFIALYSARPAEAVEHLEQAARLMPESVAARALLADAHMESFDWVAAERVLEEALAKSPRTPEDRLFLGQAIGDTRPAIGLPLMDAALAERPSGIGHVLRAVVRVNLATRTLVVADAEAAVVDAELAKRLLPGSIFSSGVAADAHLVAAAAYRKANRPEKWEDHLAAAEREAVTLARFPTNPKAIWWHARAVLIRMKDPDWPQAILKQ
jgi:tetratricopeptide (TPR) repeat protein